MSTQRVRHFVSGRRLVTAALIGVTLIAALAASTATGAINPLHVVNSTTTTTTTSTDTCGYDPASAPGPGSPTGTVSFSENTVTRAVSVYGSGLSSHVGVFTNDESGLLIGSGGSASTYAGQSVAAIGPGSLSTASNITTLPVQNLTVSLAAGDPITVSTSGHTQNWTVAAPGQAREPRPSRSPRRSRTSLIRQARMWPTRARL